MLFGLAIAVMSVMPVNRIALGTRPHWFASAADVAHAARVHYAVHVAAFGALAVLAWLATKHAESQKNQRWTEKLIALSIIMLLGFATEYFQHRIYHFALELNDISVNISSALVVFVVLATIHGLRNRSL